MLSIVFIHGLGGSRFDYKVIIKCLKQHNYNKFYEFTYNDNKSLKDIAKDFNNYIKNIKGEKVIIGLSQGGIIARLIKQNAKIITICTPHKGSLTAYLSKRYKDLRPNSELLKTLKNNNIYSIYTPFDFVVFPGWNAKYGKSKITYSLLHPLAFQSKTSLNFILEVINE
jgi:esterase/lipase